MRAALWVREFGSVYDEVKYWFARGIREFCFLRGQPASRQKQLHRFDQADADDPDLDGIELHAPEGIEVRLLHPEIVRLMRRAGFKKAVSAARDG